jgi:hypothetical protein
MFVPLQWIRNRRDQRELLKDMKAREAERQIQRKKRDDQQARALNLTLHQLQRTMDPLIAAQVYNNRFCPLGRLPEELLLRILDFLADDAVMIHCLRIVSTVFFRLLNPQADIWKDAWYLERPEWTTSHALYLRQVLRLQFRRLLQRDGRCDNCRRWNDAYGRQLFDDCKFQQNHRRCHDEVTGYPEIYRRLYCNACDSLHDVCQFSSTYQQAWKHQEERRCLGQQGSVQLCEHVQIAWASIKAHIEDWRQQQRRGGDWQACLDSFNIECHDASHDMRCTISEAPTWPRARLCTNTYGRDIVLLNLEWTPHNRIDALALTADGQIPASELRALFQRLRRLGPADTLYPPGRPGALPEMACFSPSSHIAPFIYYKMGEDDKRPPSLPPSFPRLPSDPWVLWLSCDSCYRGYGSGRNGQKLDIEIHKLRGSGGTDISWHCIVVSYQKDIMVCETTAMTNPAVKIDPIDHWLHAMDTRTYPHPQASQIRPQCKDETCANYYRRRKDYYICSSRPPADDISRRLEMRRAE